MLIFEKVCRLCLSDVGVHIIPLFNPLKDSDLCSQIFHLTDVQICEDVTLPTNICKLCHSHLENFKKFKTLVQKTDCVLRQQIESLEKINSASNLNSEPQTAIGDYTFESELYTNKERLNTEVIEDSIDLQSYAADTVLTLLSVQKNDSSDNTATMDVTNINTQKDLSNILIEKVKEECGERIPLYVSEEKKCTNSISNGLKVNRDENDYSLLQKNTVSSSDNSSEYSVNAEINAKTGKKVSLQCDICQKVFKTKTTLRRHNVVHIGHEYHKCVECHKIFAHKHNLVKHLRIHSGIRLTCTVCQKMFTQPEYLKNHMMYTHSEGDPISCDVCGRFYKNNVTLLAHKKTVHSNVTGTNKVVCTVCGKLLSSNALSKHMKTHNVNERIKCDLCDRSYKNRYIMMEHRKNHVKLPTSCCDICGKTFKTNGILKNHKLTHLSEKQFSCSMCGAKFTQGAALRTHQRIHSGVEPYTCSCGEKFRWKQTFDKHMFKCTQCRIAVY